MPVTIRGKQEPPSEQKDAASTPPSTGKVDPKNKLTSAGKGADVTRSLTERTTKSTDASKVTGTSTPTTSSARQRARERRRGRVEVSPEPDSNSPDPEASAGRIKNLAGFWSTPKDEVQVVRKKRLEVSERTQKADTETDSSDSDSDVDGLKRAQEGQPSSETIEVEVEKGRAKSIANMWQNRKDDDLPTKKTPFKLDLQTEEPSVFENEPVVLEGVVRSDDRAVMDDVIIGRPGRIKNLVVNFGTNTQSKQDTSDEEEGKGDRTVRDEVITGRPGRIKSLVVNYGTNTQSKQDSSDEDDESTEKHSSVATTKTTEEDIERGKVRNVRERWKKRQQQKSKTGSDSDSEGGDESSATEDTPQRSSTRGKKNQVIEKAKISNLRERWNRQDGSGTKHGEAPPTRRTAPNRLHSLVTAKEYGVFENEPTVRDDVVRADDEQPDIISVDKTQKMRRMWTMMDKEVMKDKEPVERVVKPAKKKNDEKRSTEEEAVAQVVKPQTTKKVLGRLQGAKEESPKPKEETSSSRSKKGHRVKGRGEVEAEKDQQQQQEPEGKGKQLQRAFTIATVADVKPSAPKSPSLKRYSRKKVA